MGNLLAHVAKERSLKKWRKSEEQVIVEAKIDDTISGTDRVATNFILNVLRMASDNNTH